MARVHVDRKRCQGIGLCEAVAPHLFEVAEDGVLSLLSEGTFAESDRQLVIDAVDGCPNQALSISED